MPNIYLSCPHVLTEAEAQAINHKSGLVFRGDGRAEAGDLCEAELEVELAWEPADRNYGADADGNRGVYVPGYWYFETSPPETCPECGYTYTAEEYAKLEAQAEKEAREYTDDGGYDGSNY